MNQGRVTLMIVHSSSKFPQSEFVDRDMKQSRSEEAASVSLSLQVHVQYDVTVKPQLRTTDLLVGLNVHTPLCEGSQSVRINFFCE